MPCFSFLDFLLAKPPPPPEDEEVELIDTESDSDVFATYGKARRVSFTGAVVDGPPGLRRSLSEPAKPVADVQRSPPLKPFNRWRTESGASWSTVASLRSRRATVNFEKELPKVTVIEELPEPPWSAR